MPVEHRAIESPMVATLGRTFPPRSPTRLSTTHGPASALQSSADAHAQPLAGAATRASRPPAPTVCHPRDHPRSQSWPTPILATFRTGCRSRGDTGLRRTRGLDGAQPQLKMQLAGWSACCTKIGIPGGGRAALLPFLFLSFPFLSFPFITSVLSNLLSTVLSIILSRPLGLAL